MKSFNTFQKRLRVALACAALVLASPCLTALPLSPAQTSESSAAHAYAGAVYADAQARAYLELLDLQTRTIDHAAVAVEEAHEQNMHLVFVLSILVAALGALCALLAMTRLTDQGLAPSTGGNRP